MSYETEDIEIEQEIEDYTYVLDITANEKGVHTHDEEYAWLMFKACSTTCSLSHKDNGMLAEKWLIEGNDGSIMLEEILYKEESNYKTCSKCKKELPNFYFNDSSDECYICE